MTNADSQTLVYQTNPSALLLLATVLRQRLAYLSASLWYFVMSYDDIEIEDMEWNEELKAFTYMCPCGDLFQITKVVTTASGLLTTAAAPSTASSE